MTYERLRLFLILVETSNLSQAAEHLRTSQPRLSQQLAKLEKELDTELFERTSRGIRLSDAGQALLPSATCIVQAYGEAFAALKRLKNNPDREFKLGVVPNTSAECLAKLLEIFHTRNPELKLTVTQAIFPSVKQQIQSGQLDACLCFEPDDFTNLNWRPMFTTPLIGISAVDSGLSEERSLAEFCKEPLALLTPSCSTRLALDRAMKKVGITPQISLEMDDPTSLIALVKRGRYVTILPEWQVAPSRLLRRTCLVNPTVTVVRGLLHNTKAEQAVRALTKACTQCAFCHVPDEFAM